MKYLKLTLFMSLLAFGLTHAMAEETGEEQPQPKTFYCNTDSGRFKYTVLSETDATVELSGFDYGKKLDLTIPETVADGGKTYTVTEIGEKVFQDCPITTLELPATVNEIGVSAFSGCSNLKYLTIPEGVTTLAYNSFARSGLERIEIPGSVTEIGGYVFNQCESLKEIVFPAGIKTIAEHAFQNCISLETINLPETLEELGDDAFRGCFGLSSAIIPGSVKIVPEGAFYQCSLLSELKLGEGIESIEGWAFSGCNMINTLVLPSTIKEIGYLAFDCTGLRDVYSMADIPPVCPEFNHLDGTTYDGPIFSHEMATQNIATLYVPEGAKSLYMSDSLWSSYFKEILESDFNEITSVKQLGENPDADIMFDLMGRPVREPQQGQIYISNGKKFILSK